jgi:hypothetical protein
MLSVRLLNTMINTRELSSPFFDEHMSPRMVCVGPHSRHICRSRQSLLENVRTTFLTNPGYHLELVDTVVNGEVDEVRGWGEVFVRASVRGFLRGEEDAQVEREWISQLDWRWWGSLGQGNVGDPEHGRWVCIRLAGMTSQPGF